MAQSNEDRIRYANDELLGKGNLSIVEEIFSSAYVVHAENKEFRGPKFVREIVGQLRSAIPDLRVVEIEILMQAGEMVAWQRTLSGTHRADMLGIPPTGKKVEWRDMLVTRFEGETIVEEWAVSDLAGQLMSKFSP